MAQILSTTDFLNGDLKLAQDQNTKAAIASILSAEKEIHYLKQIFGSTLGQALIDDLAGDPLVPVSAKWLDIFTPFDFDKNSQNWYCEGIKRALMYLFYLEVTTGQSVRNFSSGNHGVNQSAVSAQGINKLEILLYNRGVEAISLLQAFVLSDSATYPDFKGIEFEYQSPI